MLEGFEDFGESLVEELSGFFADVFGDAVVGFCHAACDGGEGIAVASYGDGGADGVFKGFGFEEGFDGLGDGVLAGFVEFVGGADFIDGKVQFVVFLFDVFPDVFFCFAGSGKVDGRGGSFGAFDAFGVVMADFGDFFGEFPDFGEGFSCPAAGADSHGCAVSKAAVGFGVIGVDPVVEGSAVAALGIGASYFLHGEDGLSGEAFVGRDGLEEGVADGEAHDGVVGEEAFI